MYTLYFSPGACSLATHAVLNEIGQEVHIIDKQSIDDFVQINPVGAVPVLIDGGKTLTEGAAIMLHILKAHPNKLFPMDDAAQQIAVQNIMFANATMHPAYSRLFFLEHAMEDQTLKHQVMNTAAKSINVLWQVVEEKLNNQAFLGGNQPSAADFMLTVYSRWGAMFPVDIVIGPNTTNMLQAIQGRSSFVKAISREQAVSEVSPQTQE